MEEISLLPPPPKKRESSSLVISAGRNRTNKPFPPLFQSSKPPPPPLYACKQRHDDDARAEEENAASKFFFAPASFLVASSAAGKRAARTEKKGAQTQVGEEKESFFICDITTTRPRAGEFRPWEIFVSPPTCHKDTCLSPPPLNSIPFSLPSACLPCLPLASFLLPRTTSRVSPKGRKQEGTQVEREWYQATKPPRWHREGGGDFAPPSVFPGLERGQRRKRQGFVSETHARRCRRRRRRRPFSHGRETEEGERGKSCRGG